jgi:hypothetical protein
MSGARPTGHVAAFSSGREITPCIKFCCEHRKRCAQTGLTCSLFRAWCNNPSVAYNGKYRQYNRVPTLPLAGWSARQAKIEAQEGWG